MNMKNHVTRIGKNHRVIVVDDHYEVQWRVIWFWWSTLFKYKVINNETVIIP